MHILANCTELCNDRKTGIVMAEEEEKKQIKPKFGWIRLAAILFIVAALAAGGTAYFARQKPEILGLKSGSTDTQAEVASLVAEVGRLMELPQEQPTVATVTDVEKLKSQPFFAKSQNGDKVLIFSGVKKAILYRPSSRLIIDVAPVTLGSEGTASAQTTEQPQTSSVVLRNGTQVVGLTRTYESVLKQKTPKLSVVDRENAKRGDWGKSIIVDVTGRQSEQAANLAQVLGISVGLMPADETTPSADFLIILGSDVQ
ncbi:MAG: LytR C-terminal domain-containing protein [Candidatus Yanofskybacteria bacterium]|nr:LytR C-terminal domain-containing protein [Candidatus Yanofskybacteria bacterium]